MMEKGNAAVSFFFFFFVNEMTTDWRKELSFESIVRVVFLELTYTFSPRDISEQISDNVQLFQMLMSDCIKF